MTTRLHVDIKMQAVALAACAAVAMAVGASVLAPASAQASDMTNIYVLKSMKVTDEGPDYVEVDTYNYIYNAKGLVKTVKGIDEAGSYRHHLKKSFTYKNNALKKIVTKYTSTPDGPDKDTSYGTGGTSKSKYSYKYKADSKGRVISEKPSGENKAYSFKYDSKGRLNKISWRAGGEEAKCTYKYNKKGLITKASFYDSSYGENAWTLKYDSRGSLTKVKCGGSTTTYKNTYKKGRLVKIYNKANHRTKTFTYQKVKVPKALASMVKTQQRVLMYEDDDNLLNFYGFCEGIASAHK